MKVTTTTIDTWQLSVERVLDMAGLPELLRSADLLLIKPNLVEALPPPITTPVALIAALVDYLRRRDVDCPMVVGEGTGSLDYDTFHCFDRLGYIRMAREKKVGLVDLNGEELQRLSDPACSRWPEIYLPRMLAGAFVLSVPVLKAHSLATVTLTMKNMMGCAPPSHYQAGNSWGKSAFHQNIQAAIFDLNRYRCPDFTLLDASVGMAEAHLWGRHCEPPVGQLAASGDPVAIDSYGAGLLDRDWRTIGHIAMADGVLGTADPLEIIRC